MNKFTNPLKNVRIASPCSQKWDQMSGDERARFCGECNLNVYNLSGMSRREAENLILQSEGDSICVRFFRRADGTILTKDCPVGWRAVKRKISRTATACASLVSAFLGAVGLTRFFAESSQPPPPPQTMPVAENLIPVAETFPNKNTRGEVNWNDSDVMGAIVVEPKDTGWNVGGKAIVSAKNKPVKNRRQR